LKALVKMLDGHCEALDPAAQKPWSAVAQLTPEVDRARQIDQLLRKCP
jgi:hypothetical protein